MDLIDHGDRWQVTDRSGELPRHAILRKAADGSAENRRYRVEADGTVAAKEVKPERRPRQPKVPCVYLGPQLQLDGKPYTVKCNCGCGGKNKMVAVHACNHPDREKCVPSMRRDWDADHQTEAAIYQACNFCELKTKEVPCTSESLSV